MSTVFKLTLGFLFMACASCTSDSSSAPDGNIFTATEKVTATPAVTATNLEISGMTCQGCVSKVEKSLAALPNVKKVTVRFEDKKAVVLVAGKVDVATLIKAVEKGGFKATETLPEKE